MRHLLPTMFRAALAAVLLAAPVARAGDYEDGVRAWNERRYRPAYEVLVKLRETPYGRNAQVDYMLGTSGCRLPDLREWGVQVLEWMLRRYPLPEDCRAIIDGELARCRAAAADASSLVTLDRLGSIIGATARMSGKMYYFVGQKEGLNNFAAVRVREVDPKKLRERLVPLADPARAVSSAKVRLATLGLSGFEVLADGRFLLADRSGKSEKERREMARFLERYLAFLEREYEATLPDAFVTVYLVSTPDDIARLADKLHGLELGHATLGYSFRDDLSVLAVVPTGFTVGTVQHELFHLAVRSRFGDIPQWLDEGIASLYEVSRLDRESAAGSDPSTTADRFRCTGLPNWRGKVLREFWFMRPSIEQMVRSDWYAFEQPQLAKPRQFMDPTREPPSADHMAVTLATARYFTLFLQERGKLGALYQQLRAQRPGTISEADAAAAAVAALSQVLGKPIAEIDRDFAAWFGSLPPQP